MFRLYVFSACVYVPVCACVHVFVEVFTVGLCNIFSVLFESKCYNTV